MYALTGFKLGILYTSIGTTKVRGDCCAVKHDPKAEYGVRHARSRDVLEDENRIMCCLKFQVMDDERLLVLASCLWA